MSEKKKYLVIAMAAAVLTLMISAGFALAQDDAAPADGQEFGPRGGNGPGGFGERGEMRNLMVGGEVVAVSDSSITLKTIRSDEEVTVTVNESTIYRTAEGEASLADVVAGEHVGIKLTEERAEGVEMVAETVIIGAPHRPDRPHAAIGEVTSVDGNSVTIATPEGDKQFTIPEISEGMELGVAADEEGNVKAVIYDPPDKPEGAPSESPAEAEQT